MVSTTDNPTSSTSTFQHQVMEFDGTNDYIEVAEHTNPTTAITVSAWAKSNTDTWNDHGCLVSKRSPFILHPDKGTKSISFYVYLNGQGKHVGGSISNIKQWHHYAGTFDGKTIKVFVDGVEVASKDIFSSTTAIDSDSGCLCIGKDDETNRYFNGQMSEVRIWNKARTAEEISADMNQRLTGQESGLVGYWTLNKTDSDTQQVIDRSTNSNHGTIKGEATIVDDSDDIPLRNRVAEFDGTNDYIEVPYSATINPEQFTVSCWAKVTGGQGSYRSPVTSRNSSGSARQGYKFYAGSNNKWQMWVGNAGDWKVATTEVDVVLNTWTHLAGTYDGSKVNFYINGELAAELSTSFTVNTTYPLRIGAGASERSDLSNSYLFPGQVAEVRLWNQGRTLEEISADMNYRLTGQESGLVGYWALNKTDSDTQQVQDLSSNSNHGTIEGEATIVDDSELPID